MGEPNSRAKHPVYVFVASAGVGILAAWLRQALLPFFGADAIYLFIYPSIFLVSWAFGATASAVTGTVGLLFSFWLRSSEYEQVIGLASAIESIFVLLSSVGVAYLWERSFLSSEVRHGKAFPQSTIRDKTLESVVRSREGRLTLAIRGGKMATWDWDCTTDQIAWNEEHFRQLGYEVDEVTPSYNAWKNRIHPDDLEMTETTLSQCMVAGRDYHATFRTLWPNGTVRWIDARGEIVRDATGKPIRCFGVMVDISDLKTAELVIVANEARSRFLADAASCLLSATNVETAIDTICRAGEKLLGVDKVMYQRNIGNEHSPPNLARLSNKHLFAVVIDKEMCGELVAGNYRPGSLAPDTCQTLSIFRDLTAIALQRSRLLTELEVAKNEAERAVIAKSQFLAAMSHEIRTPLTSILGFSEILATTALDQTLRTDLARRVLSNGKQLMQLIDDILDLSKIEYGRFKIEPRDMLLSTFLADIQSTLAPIAAAKNLSFRIINLTHPQERINTDPLRLKQILLNIAGNSIKFTSAGQVTVEVRTSENRGRLVLKVTDTGIGINSEKVAALFEPFVQGDASTSRVYGGSGLGLALSRRLAQALGGDIALIENSVGGGCSFEITISNAKENSKLPELLAAQDISAAQKEPPPAQDSNGLALRGLCVLVTDDVADIRLLIGKLLEASGAIVDFAIDGHDAIAKVQQNKYDVVLMDVRMPKLDGYETLSEMRRLGIEVPVIAMTADAFPKDRAKSLEAGCADFLPKPLNRQNLVNKIIGAIKRRAG